MTAWWLAPYSSLCFLLNVVIDASISSIVHFSFSTTAYCWVPENSPHTKPCLPQMQFSVLILRNPGGFRLCAPPPRNIYPSLEFGTKYSPIMCAQKWVYCPTYTCITLHKRYLVMWKQVQIHKNRTPSAIPRLFTPQIYCKLISPW